MKARMETRRVTHQHIIEYELIKTSGLFNPQNLSLLSAGRVENARRFVVVDANVARYHTGKIQRYFAQHGVEAKMVTFPGGEEHKTIEHYLAIVRELDAFPIHRRDEPIIAIGGGVLTDLVGFVASSYRRGLPHIKVPTTLMGYVDAAIGVKNGLNYNENKNRLGAFSPPLKVFLDRSLLKTLPKRHILNGVCEIIKLAIIKDAGLFAALEEYGARCANTHFQCKEGDRILDRAIAGMLEELEPDFYEQNLARKVDFGHTFSYGLETRYEGRLFHGEAVLLDVALSTLIARARGLLCAEEAQRIFRLIETLEIPLDVTILDPDLLWRSLMERTYHRNGLQRVPLPDGIGRCEFLNDIKPEEIQTAVSEIRQEIAIAHAES